MIYVEVQRYFTKSQTTTKMKSLLLEQGREKDLLSLIQCVNYMFFETKQSLYALVLLQWGRVGLLAKNKGQDSLSHGKAVITHRGSPP